MESERFERVFTVMQRGVPDRVPWTLWGHFPAVNWLNGYSWEKANRDGEESAKAHMALLRELDYKMDLLKVTPFYRYMACQWGSKFLFKDNDEKATTMEVAVKEPEDWGRLWVLDPRKELRESLRAVEILARDLRRMPFIYSIPSPIVQALHGVSTPGRVYADIETHPDSVKEGLDIITQTCIDFSRECVAEGAAGVFFGIGGGGDIWSRLSVNQLKEYALEYDKKILNAVDAPIKVLHICSAKDEDPQKNGGLMENGWFKNYPVNAINWADKTFTPVEEAKKIYGDEFCILGGLDHAKTLRFGTPEQVVEDIKRVLTTVTEKRGFMLGPGCTTFQDMPIANYNAVGKAVIKFGMVKK